MKVIQKNSVMIFIYLTLLILFLILSSKGLIALAIIVPSTSALPVLVWVQFNTIISNTISVIPSKNYFSSISITLLA